MLNFSFNAMNLRLHHVLNSSFKALKKLNIYNLFTIWLAVPLEKVVGAELLVAVVAGEVLGVPRVAQGGDHLACKE